MPVQFVMPETAPPIIPVVVLETPEQGPPLARALMAGGIRAIEVTLRSDAALEGIAAISEAVPHIYLGAGTIRNTVAAERSIEAGAQFLVSPGATQPLLEAAEEIDVPLLPGVATPSEAMALAECGFQRLKFFPADVYGGAKALRAFSGPLRDLSFCPTGGVGATNAAEYLSLSNVFAVGGSWLAPPALMREGKWEEIEQLARKAVQRPMI